MVSNLLGAFVRAILVAILVALPSLLLPGITPAARDTALVFALIGAALTLFEYGSSHPGLVEFRYAPPFNRIRFISLFVTVLCLALILRNEVSPGDVTRVVFRIGDLIGRAMDFPASPVQLLTGLLTNDGAAANTAVVRAAAGIAYVVSLLSLAVFAISIRVAAWPLGSGPFNIWVNLPTFDPAESFDVEDRLMRDARVNVIFGFTLPFLMPLVARVSSGYFDFTTLHSQTLIWTVAVWAFLPASLFMRGIAMARIARLIRRKRERLHVSALAGDGAPA